MKKLAFLLALFMIFSVFLTACNGDGEASEASDASTESSKEEDQSLIRTGVAVGESPAETVMSNGASYTTSYDAPENYPDTYGTELTDGIRTATPTSNYSDETLSGYLSSSGRLKVVVDLGTVCDKLYKFKVGFLSTKEAGIAPPGTIVVHVSVDGKKWDNLGLLRKPEYVDGTMQEAELVLSEFVRARYVRFYITPSHTWMFLDEVQAIADIDSKDVNVEYLENVNNTYKQLGTPAKPTNGGEINFDLNKVLISKDALYDFQANQSDVFKDNGDMLTDGIISGFYEGKTWVGFKGNATVKLDLGKEVNDISNIEASFFTNTVVKQYLPLAIKLRALDKDGKLITELPTLYGNTVIVNGNYVFSLPLSKTITARYIEFEVIGMEDNMCLVEEFAVYAYRDVQEIDLYPPVKLENNPTEWGSEATSEYKNLILNKTQQIICAGDPGKDNYSNNTPADSTLMTDGKKSPNHSTDIHNTYFFKFCNGGGRTIVYDLEHVSAIDKITARFTQNLDWAVKAPAAIQVCISLDGETWFEISSMKQTGEGANRICEYETKLSRKVKARYVLLDFPVTAWAGCDEIEIFGTTSVSGANEPSKYPQKSVLSNERIKPSADLLGGAKDLCLLYQNVDRYYTVEDLIPYLAYVDENGEQKDTMFDSFLFLFIGNFPVGGGQAHQNGTKPGWEWAVNDAFKEGQNLMALEEAAGQVKKNLGLSEDFKYKVTLTLYYPSLGITNFGDVDGDGVTENLDILSDRKKVMQWYIDLIRDTFDAQNFKHVELVGYYWFHEAMESKDTESMELINSVADMVHEKDCDFFWIPYFTANGYDAWAEYGFDVAVMQPNYVFELDKPYSNITNCANLTKLYGMGVEMEICSEALSSMNFFKRYMQYVAGGIEYGYMTDTIVMYYQSVNDFRDACNSKTVMGRMVYDYTYHFIKEDLQYKPETIAPITATVSKDTSYTGKIEFATNDKLREIAINIFPDHGSVSLNEDGTFTFYPEIGYTGEVKFSFVYSEYLGWSDPCEVTITVK